jgi:hypothetical protein
MIFGMIYLLREVTFDVDCAVGTGLSLKQRWGADEVAASHSGKEGGVVNETGCWIKIIQTIHFGAWGEMTAVLAQLLSSRRCGGERGLDGRLGAPVTTREFINTHSHG